MNKPESSAIRVHEDPVLFAEALNFTAAETTLAAQLIEKDYFCSVLLQFLAANASTLIFKGGTCLTKVHLGFYRLSEDLDFSIPISEHSSRSERREKARAVKESMLALPEELKCFRVIEKMKGANNSTQYICTVGYNSVLTGQAETIKIEVSLREPLLTSVINGGAHTILLDPVSGGPMVDTLSVACLSKLEAIAEKFRAAMTRREPAIRDFYDIDHSIRNKEVRHQDDELIRLVRQKLAVPGNDPVVVTSDKLANLHRQVVARLRPVLRESDLEMFDLDRAFAVVGEMANAVGREMQQ